MNEGFQGIFGKVAPIKHSPIDKLLALDELRLWRHGPFSISRTGHGLAIIQGWRIKNATFNSGKVVLDSDAKALGIWILFVSVIPDFKVFLDSLLPLVRPHCGDFDHISCGVLAQHFRLRANLSLQLQKLHWDDDLVLWVAHVHAWEARKLELVIVFGRVVVVQRDLKIYLIYARMLLLMTQMCL